MTTLNDLNMRYINAENNDFIDGGAILECSRSWNKRVVRKLVA